MEQKDLFATDLDSDREEYACVVCGAIHHAEHRIDFCSAKCEKEWDRG